MRRSEQREHIFKLLFMTQFNSENEMSDQVSMYFDTLGELEGAPHILCGGRKWRGKSGPL